MASEAARIRGAIRKHHEVRRVSIDLSPATNLPSNYVREIVASDAFRRVVEKKNGHLFFGGTGNLSDALSIAEELARKLFKADRVSLSPITGNLAILSVILGLARPGDFIMNPEYGGYGLPLRLASPDTLNLRLEGLPVNRDDLTIELNQSLAKIERVKPKVVMLGASYFLFPHPVREINRVASGVGATVVYDGAHVLGLIAGGAFQDPLGEGCPILTGSTNKTLPGPHRGIIAVRGDEDLFAKAVAAVEPPPLLQSTCDVGSTIAVGITCAEMLEFGHEYASQVIKNAQTLGRALHSEGVEDLMGANRGFTGSHMVIQRIGDLASESAVRIQERLELANIFVDFGIRYGTNEVTRRGMKEAEMKHIAELIASVVVRGADPVKIAAGVAELSSRFQNVHFTFDTTEEAFQYFEMTHSELR